METAPEVENSEIFLTMYPEVFATCVISSPCFKRLKSVPSPLRLDI